MLINTFWCGVVVTDVCPRPPAPGGREDVRLRAVARYRTIINLLVICDSRRVRLPLYIRDGLYIDSSL